MTVLCEAISVIAKAESNVQAYGDFDAFNAIVPTRTPCADNQLVRARRETVDAQNRPWREGRQDLRRPARGGVSFPAHESPTGPGGEG
jgi:hypothetical protein